MLSLERMQYVNISSYVPVFLICAESHNAHVFKILEKHVSKMAFPDNHAVVRVDRGSREK